MSSSILLLPWNLPSKASLEQASVTKGYFLVLNMISFQNLSTYWNILASAGSYFWISSALKIFSKYIQDF